MATATLRNDDTATITATCTRLDGKIRVIFESPTAPGEGFSLPELAVLEGAIAHARRQMLEDDVETTPTLSVVRPEHEKDDIEARYHTQLHQMNPVPT